MKQLVIGLTLLGFTNDSGPIIDDSSIFIRTVSIDCGIIRGSIFLSEGGGGVNHDSAISQEPKMLVFLLLSGKILRHFSKLSICIFDKVELHS